MSIVEPPGPQAPAARPLRRDVRAAEYRARALEAAALAHASVLIHVREKHETSAARWLQLAALSEADTRPTAPVSLGDPTCTE